MIELRHLRYFVAVAEELHFGRAARRLGIAQPPLSQQIRNLEKALGVRLLVRTTRRVALTPAGRALRRGALRTLAEYERTIEAARSSNAEVATALRVGYTAYAAAAVLPQILRRFRAVAPRVELDMIEDSSSGNAESVANHDVDVAFVTGPAVPNATELCLTSHVVHREPLLVALPHDHTLAARRSVPLMALAHEAMVLFPRSLAPVFHDHLVALCSAAGFVPRVTRRIAGYDRIVAAVADGGVVSLVPRSVATKRTGAVFRALRERPSAEISLVWSEISPSAALGKFVNSALDHSQYLA